MELSGHLATNLLNLRRARNWSQQKLADRAGMPRSTVANVECGSGNPSLHNLAMLAAALGVSIEELIARPRPRCQLIPADEVPVIEESARGSRIHQLLPEAIRGLEIIRLELAPGANKPGQPHLPGTKEYFHGLSGEFNVLVAGELYPVRAGDVLAFAGDQAHSYLNRSRRQAEALSVVVPIPLTAG